MTVATVRREYLLDRVQVVSVAQWPSTIRAIFHNWTLRRRLKSGTTCPPPVRFLLHAAKIARANETLRIVALGARNDLVA